jgi:hypothetical protein
VDFAALGNAASGIEADEIGVEVTAGGRSEAGIIASDAADTPPCGPESGWAAPRWARFMFSET